MIGLSLLICSVFATPDRDANSITVVYFAFILLEVAIGMYFPGKLLQRVNSVTVLGNYVKYAFVSMKPNASLCNLHFSNVVLKVSSNS